MTYVVTMRSSGMMSSNRASYLKTGPPSGPPRLTSTPPSRKSIEYPLLWSVEPEWFHGGVRERCKDPGGLGVVDALDDKSRVLH